MLREFCMDTSDMEISYRPIGVVRSPFSDLREMPIQPSSETSAPGKVEVFPEFAPALKDLDGFSHVILIYHLHRATRVDLTVTPFLGSEKRGIFATRAPTRPNPIGMSVIEIERIEGNCLYLRNIDILDQTPVLDIKPYVSEFDHPADTNAGWLEEKKGEARATKSDDRFL
jgi:tRNA-Thr(GGU) m(6)t(6)A37 methyltransferase TsaA